VLRAVRDGETFTAFGVLATPAEAGASRITVTLRGVVRDAAFAGSVRFLGPGGLRGRGRASGALSPEQVSIQFAGAREEQGGCDLAGEFTGSIAR
jgi:hypothetical protein